MATASATVPARLAPVVDTRGEGGYASFPPLGGYVVVRDVEPSRELLGRWLHTMSCKPTQRSELVVGEHVGEVLTPEGHTRRTPELVRRDRTHGYRLGSLDAAWQAFSHVTGLDLEWAR